MSWDELPMFGQSWDELAMFGQSWDDLAMFGSDEPMSHAELMFGSNELVMLSLSCYGVDWIEMS